MRLRSIAVLRDCVPLPWALLDDIDDMDCVEHLGRQAFTVDNRREGPDTYLYGGSKLWPVMRQVLSVPEL